MPYVYGVLGRVVLHRFHEFRAGVRTHGIRQRGKQIPREAGVEGRAVLAGHRPRHDHGIDTELAEDRFGLLRFVSIGVAVTDDRDAVALGQAREQVEGADSLTRGERVREFFVEHRNTEGTHRHPYREGNGFGVFCRASAKLCKAKWRMARQ